MPHSMRHCPTSDATGVVSSGVALQWTQLQQQLQDFGTPLSCKALARIILASAQLPQVVPRAAGRARGRRYCRSHRLGDITSDSPQALLNVQKAWQLHIPLMLCWYLPSWHAAVLAGNKRLSGTLSCSKLAVYILNVSTVHMQHARVHVNVFTDLQAAGAAAFEGAPAPPCIPNGACDTFGCWDLCTAFIPSIVWIYTLSLSTVASNL